MTVYVDDMQAEFRRMVMCHMAADTIDELQVMAQKIGLDRAWYQDAAGHPHYDVSKSKRALAIKNGAVEVTAKELVRILQRRYPG